MKLLALVLLLALQATAPHEDYPGQANHGEPPADWTCVHQNYELNVPADHACNCERSCDSETGKVVEDKSCKVWCFPASCRCELGNMKACK